MIRALGTLTRCCCRWTLPVLLAVVDRVCGDGLTESQVGRVTR